MNTAILTIGFLACYYGATIMLTRGVKIKTRELCICGIMIALTLILESIRIPLPTGATISCCSVVPLMILAIVCDYRLTFICGWVCGILAMFMVPGWQPIHWAQLLVEHMVCFSCMGYVGVFGIDKRWKILWGITLASVLKLCGHLISGMIFFSQNAWDGWGAWGYSLIYNISQNVPLCIASGVIVMALPLKNIRQVCGKEAI